MVMIAVVAFKPKVIGMRMATPVVGPSPGSKPMRVPNVTPMKQKKRL